MHRPKTSFLFDLDGAVVDSVYQHVLSWREALESEGIQLSVWRIHRKDFGRLVLPHTAAGSFQLKRTPCFFNSA
jgi:beta-phosphoglucomutase-like phosphatase (HAD superfamily)